MSQESNPPARCTPYARCPDPARAGSLTVWAGWPDSGGPLAVARPHRREYLSVCKRPGFRPQTPVVLVNLVPTARNSYTHAPLLECCIARSLGPIRYLVLRAGRALGGRRGMLCGHRLRIERNRDGRRHPGGSDGLRQPGVRICDANRPPAGWRRSCRRQQSAPVGFPARLYPATGESSTRDSRPRTTSNAGTARLH